TVAVTPFHRRCRQLKHPLPDSRLSFRFGQQHPAQDDLLAGLQAPIFGPEQGSLRLQIVGF
ncbi:hypothetical protein, partial [Pseudomonas meliae]|uniref:hypothetical protein n=1 Tax=Pseudomonas meliae TaxID=86176 RepID=UPI001C3F4827